MKKPIFKFLINKKLKKDIINIVLDYFVNSRNYNGIHINNLEKNLKKEWEEFKSLLVELIRDEIISVIDEDTDVNPNIIRVGFESIEKQVKKIQRDNPGYMCIYPSQTILKD